jgi:hypothetical protein
MNPIPLRVAVLVVRAWTRLYTWRLPEAIRESRRAEIESDLWESQHDGAGDAASALQIIARLLLGAPDDLRWRVTHGGRLDAVIATIAAAVVLFMALFLVDLGRARRLPVPPAPASSLLRPITPVQPHDSVERR